MNYFVILALFLLFFISVISILYGLKLIKKEKFNGPDDIEIFVVSLEKDEERRKDISILNKKPNIFNAVNGKLLDRDKLIKNNIIGKDCPLKLGEIGCYLSHYYILNHIRGLNKEYVLIIEDDINFEDINKLDFNEIINNSPDDFEILYLGFNYFHKKEGLEYIPSDVVYGTHAYIVKVSSIQQHLDKLLPIEVPIDIKLPTIFTSYTVHPKMVGGGRHSVVSNTQGIN